MAHGKAATVYAKAIYASAGEQAQALIGELRQWTQLNEESKDLDTLIHSNMISSNRKEEVLEDIIAAAKCSKLFANVLRVLAQANRLGLVSEIEEKLTALVQNASGVAEIRVTSASNLNPDEKTGVENKFKSILEKDIEADYTVDPNLYAGLKVSALGRTFDGTLSSWLDHFEERLVGG